MTQEVRTILILTLEVDTHLSKWEIAQKLMTSISSKDKKIDVIGVDVLKIEEEAEIYKTDE